MKHAGGKRKRESTPSKEGELASKRAKSEATNGTEGETTTKRDRENTSIFCQTFLPT